MAVFLGVPASDALDGFALPVVWRNHPYDQTFQRLFKRAVEQASITKLATPHT
jgi:hypothetical protein